MIRTALRMALVGWVGLAGPSLAQNLIQNGDCEVPAGEGMPPLGWTEIAGTWACAALTTPFDGSLHFSPSGDAVAELQQDVDVSAYAASIDLGLATYSFAGFVQSADEVAPNLPDQALIQIDYLATETTHLGGVRFGPVGSVGSWQELAGGETAIPATTRYLRVRLVSEELSGPTNDAYYDGLSLTVEAPVPLVPTLSQWALAVLALALGGCAVMLLRRNRDLIAG